MCAACLPVPVPTSRTDLILLKCLVHVSADIYGNIDEEISLLSYWDSTKSSVESNFP